MNDEPIKLQLTLNDENKLNDEPVRLQLTLNDEYKMNSKLIMLQLFPSLFMIFWASITVFMCPADTSFLAGT